MDTLEYGRIIEALDGQIARAREAAEERARREAVEQRLRLLGHWEEGLGKRRAELARYGAAPVVDLDAKLSEIVAERDALKAQLNGAVAQPAAAPAATAPMSEADAAEVGLLMEEIAKAPLSGFGPETRWALFEVWAIRWKTVACRVGEAATRGDIRLRATYGRIMDAMKAEPKRGPFIEALNPRASADWPTELRRAKARLDDLLAEEAHGRQAEAARQDLEAFVGSGAMATGGEESDRRLRHLIREAARCERMREGIADLVRPHRNRLEPEFSFLWPRDEDDDPVEEGRNLSNRDVMSRLVRRMLNKGMIGEKYCPVDMLAKGFPPHDLGRAKEAVEVLLLSGVAQAGKSGQVASLSVEWTGKVKAFLEGLPMGAEGVDSWCRIPS